jgi:predicted PurR-regulated permease PerM
MSGRSARTIATLLVGAAFVWVLSGYFVPLILGASIALLLFPAYDYLVIRKTWSAPLAASTLTLGVTVLLILPATLISIRGVRFLIGRIQGWRDSPFSGAPGDEVTFAETLGRIPGVSTLLTNVSEALHMEPAEVLENSVGFFKNAGVKLANALAGILSSLPAVAIGVFLMILAIYFFLRDGSRVVHFLRSNSFFPEEQTDEIFTRFRELCRAVLLASLVSGFTQSLIYLVGGAIAGLDDLALIVFAVFLTSFIPVIGASPLTFGMAAYVFATQSKSAGIILLVAAFLASVSDNFVRPIVLRGGANLHPFIAILALLGGLQVFGFAGVFIGPILAGMFFVLLDAQAKANHGATGQLQ